MITQPADSTAETNDSRLRHDHFDRVRRHYDERAQQLCNEHGRYYHELLRIYYSALVPPGVRVLELGCGLGDLLAAVQPSQGVGVDSSHVVIDRARKRHPAIDLHCTAAETFASDEPFDYILLSDLVNEVYDVQDLLLHLHALSHPRTRLIVSFFNHLWRPILSLAEKLGAKAPSLPQNWLSTNDMANLLDLAGWQLLKTEGRILWPLHTPIIGTVCNRWLAPFIRHCCLTTIQIARPKPAPRAAHLAIPGSSESQRRIERGRVETGPPHFTCSVIIPAKNEAGNIQELVRRIPAMGEKTELIFVEGGSTDGTRSEIARVIGLNPTRDIRLLSQTGQGKAQAVRQAFSAAHGDLLFILDADLSVLPEELVKFYGAMRSGAADFLNGVRSVYPIEHGAMRFFNMVGNKVFSLMLAFIMGQTVKDTLCGTKVLYRHDYEGMAVSRTSCGIADPFGDFDLLLGAAKLNLRIVDIPVHYRARAYGQTNIQRWRHGWMLLRFACLAARRLRFISLRGLRGARPSEGDYRGATGRMI